MLSGKPEMILDREIREEKYPHLNPTKLIKLLDK
jgi:hypothetical protein